MNGLRNALRRNGPSYVAAPLVLIAIGLLASTNNYLLFLATSAAISYILTVAFNLLYGYAGIFNMAQVLIFGLGAFVSVYAETKMGGGFWVGLVLAVVVSALVSVVVAIPTRRLSGLFMAILTLAAALAGAESLRLWTSFTGGVNGIYIIPNPSIFGYQLVSGTTSFYALCAVFALITFDLSVRLDRSPLGRRFVALREGPRVLAAVGVSPASVRIAAFAVAGALAGLSGTLYASFQLTISLNSFDLDRLIALLIATIVGGAGKRLGPIFGVVVLVALDELSLSTGGDENLILGIGTMVLVAASTGGLASLSDQLAGFLRRWVRRHGEPAVPPAPAAGRRSVSEVALTTPDRMLEQFGQPLTAEGTTVRFGANLAVRDVALTAAPGEIIGVIGPNGAGKTTFLNAVTGDAAAEGRISLGRHVLTGRRPEQIVRAGLARTFQSPQLIGELSVVENILLGADIHRGTTVVGQALDTRKVREETRSYRRTAQTLLEELGLSDIADQPARSQPYGVQRLVEIIRNLMLSPAFLLLDEPGAGLSDQERTELGTLLTRISGKQLGVLVIDHNLDLIRAACSRLVVFQEGRVIADGDVDEMLAHDAVVAAYVGA